MAARMRHARGRDSELRKNEENSDKALYFKDKLKDSNFSRLTEPFGSTPATAFLSRNADLPGNCKKGKANADIRVAVAAK
jgi:hypothetical protein